MRDGETGREREGERGRGGGLLIREWGRLRGRGQGMRKGERVMVTEREREEGWQDLVASSG